MVQSSRIPLSVQLNLFYLSRHVNQRYVFYSRRAKPKHWITVADITQL